MRSPLLFSNLGHPHHCLTAAGLRVTPHSVSHPCHRFRSVFFNQLKTSRKSDRSFCGMLRLRAFPSFMAFQSACVPARPSWPAYSARCTCKVGLSLFSMTTCRLTSGLPPVSQLIYLRCVRIHIRRRQSAETKVEFHRHMSADCTMIGGGNTCAHG